MTNTQHTLAFINYYYYMHIKCFLFVVSEILVYDSKSENPICLWFLNFKKDFMVLLEEYVSNHSWNS